MILTPFPRDPRTGEESMMVTEAGALRGVWSCRSSFAAMRSASD